MKNFAFQFVGFIWVFALLMKPAFASGEILLEEAEIGTGEMMESEETLSAETVESSSQILENQTNSSSGEIIIELNSATGSTIMENYSGTNVTSSATGEIILSATGSDLTENSANSAQENLISENVVLNEIMVNPNAGKEWIELYNISQETVDLTNWQIFDAVGLRYTFTEDSSLEANAFLTLEFSNVLNNGGDEIYLKNAENELIDQFSYGTEDDLFQTIQKGESVGRSPDGSENWILYTTENVTPNQPNFAYYEIQVPIVNVVTQTGSGKAILTWAEITDANFAFYQVWENQVGTGFILLDEISENTYQIQNLATNNFYEYFLKACNSQGNCTADDQSQLVLIKAFLQLQLNEIFANADGADEGKEWIELAYAGSGELLLEDYFVEIDDKKTIDLSGFTIGGSGAYLTLNPADFGITLKNSNGKIVLKKNGIESNLDEITYTKAQEDYSWRRNLTTNLWEEQIRPTPNAVNVLTNNLPQAFIALQGSRRTSGEAPFSVNVTGVYSHDPDGDQLTCFWDYADGTFSDQCNPANHKYAVGEFDLMLTVTDVLGGTGSAVQHISVKEPKNSGGSVSSIQPEFTAEQTYIQQIQLFAFLPNPEGKDNEQEWIEIRNYGTETIALDWWQLDDGEGGSRPYFLPINTYLEPQEIKRFSVLTTGLNLNNAEDSVRLLTPNGAIYDSVNYVKAPENGIYQRNAKNLWEWELQNVEEKTESLSEDLAEVVKITTEIVAEQTFAKFDFEVIEISEFLPSSSQGDREFEWIELYNNDNAAHDLCGWKLDDELEKGSSAYLFPENTIIEPKSYFIIYSRDSKIALNNGGDTVNLINPENEIQASFTYTKTKKDWSWSKAELHKFTLTDKTTPNQQNYSYAEVRKQKTPEVKIASILPNPQGKDQNVEYFTIKNHADKPVNLKDWQIFNQKMNAVILPDFWLQPQEERKIYYEESKLTLNNSKGALSLFTNQGVRVDFLNYNDVQEDEIFTHTGGNIAFLAKKTKISVVLNNSKQKDYDDFWEIEGIVLSEIDPQENIFWLKTDNAREIQVQFNSQEIPPNIAEQIFQKGNKILLKGNYAETGSFVLEDVILLKQQLSFARFNSADLQTLPTFENLFYLLLGFWLVAFLMQKKKIWIMPKISR